MRVYASEFQGRKKCDLSYSDLAFKGTLVNQISPFNFYIFDWQLIILWCLDCFEFCFCFGTRKMSSWSQTISNGLKIINSSIIFTPFNKQSIFHRTRYLTPKKLGSMYMQTRERGVNIRPPPLEKGMKNKGMKLLYMFKVHNPFIQCQLI